MRAVIVLLSLCLSSAAFACSGCRPAVLAQVFSDGFARTLTLLLVPLAITAAVGFAIPWERRK